MDVSGFTPAQRRTWEGLLAGHTMARPAADPEAGRRWRARLEEGTAAAAALVPPGERSGLWLSKSKLDALDCDGRYLDQMETPFAWTSAMVVGDLAHKAIELDLVGDRRRDAAEIVHHAWLAFVDSGHAAAEFLSMLGGAEADDLRARAMRRMLEFREAFPPLPADILRAEVDMTVRLHGGAILLRGRPDLVVGRVHGRERRQILVDLKTGNRQRHHRADLRFYALLATVKYGVAPFRVATYYLDEADWEHEDVDDDVLEAAVRGLLDKVERAATLDFARPPESALRLVAGPACRWCGRSLSCPAAAESARAGDEHEA